MVEYISNFILSRIKRKIIFYSSSTELRTPPGKIWLFVKLNIFLLLSTILLAAPVTETVLSFDVLWRGIIGKECFGIIRNMSTICTIFYWPDDPVILRFFYHWRRFWVQVSVTVIHFLDPRGLCFWLPWVGPNVTSRVIFYLIQHAGILVKKLSLMFSGIIKWYNANSYCYYSPVGYWHHLAYNSAICRFILFLVGFRAPIRWCIFETALLPASFLDQSKNSVLTFHLSKLWCGGMQGAIK